MFRRIIIQRHERGLRFRDGNFIAPLAPGEHVVFAAPWDAAHETVDVADTRKARLDHAQLEAVIGDSELRAELEVIELAEGQGALVYLDGREIDLVGPGTHAYWKANGRITWRPASLREQVRSLAIAR